MCNRILCLSRNNLMGKHVVVWACSCHPIWYSTCVSGYTCIVCVGECVSVCMLCDVCAALCVCMICMSMLCVYMCVWWPVCVHHVYICVYMSMLCVYVQVYVCWLVYVCGALHAVCVFNTSVLCECMRNVSVLVCPVRDTSCECCVSVYHV